MNDTNLAKNLTYLIDEKIISANKLLEITNHNSTGLVAMWKSGKRIMRIEDILKVANYLNLTVDDLVNKNISAIEKFSTIYEVKDVIRRLPSSIMNDESKTSLINMIDTLCNLNQINQNHN